MFKQVYNLTNNWILQFYLFCSTHSSVGHSVPTKNPRALDPLSTFAHERSGSVARSERAGSRLQLRGVPIASEPAWAWRALADRGLPQIYCKVTTAPSGVEIGSVAAARRLPQYPLPSGSL